jgi:ABC-type sugar transport system permease subunit
MREIPIEVPGFEGRNLKVIDNDIFKPYDIHIDGQKVRRTRFKYIVTDNNGKETEIKFIWNILLDACKISIKDQVFIIKEPLHWYQYLWAGWPMVMLFVGGAIGGGLGAAATVVNTQIFRSKLHGFFKYLITLVISISAFMIWLIIAMYLNRKFTLPKQ